jgi:4-hydroxy-tetrahydrodipicolinate synthase
MITPFKADQSVDYDAAVGVAEKLVADGKADSIIVSGTTGEFFTMNYEERVHLYKVLQEAVGKKIPLIAGTGATSTVEAVALSRKAEELGYELLMVIVPYFTRPRQEELIAHFTKVAGEVSANILLYNIPIFVGVTLETLAVAELSRIGNIVGIKEEAELNPKHFTEFINRTDDDFIIYCGDDTMLIESYAQGGRDRVGGVVSGGAHLIGDRIRRLIDTFLAGQVEEVATAQRSFHRLYRTLGMNGRMNPVALLKAAMNMLGYQAGVPRSPLLPATKAEEEVIRAVLEDLSVL